MSKRVTIQKCPCGHRGCRLYGLSNGDFYEGTGFDYKTAKKYADLWNADLERQAKESSDAPRP